MSVCGGGDRDEGWQNSQVRWANEEKYGMVMRMMRDR
jgi:hypothetical protein